MTRSFLSAAGLALALVLAPAAAAAEDSPATPAARVAVQAASTAVVAHPDVLLLARIAGGTNTAQAEGAATSTNAEPG